MKKLYGVITAMTTPFTADNKVDVAALEAQTEYLIQKGVQCLYPCGTTGEMYLMSAEERELVAETVVKKAARARHRVHPRGCHGPGRDHPTGPARPEDRCRRRGRSHAQLFHGGREGHGGVLQDGVRRPARGLPRLCLCHPPAGAQRRVRRDHGEDRCRVQERGGREVQLCGHAPHQRLSPGAGRQLLRGARCGRPVPAPVWPAAATAWCPAAPAPSPRRL